MDLTTLLTGIGALLTGTGGCIVIIHEFRRRDRKALKQEVDELSVDVASLRANNVICRRYAYMLAERLTEAGLDVPEPPT